MKQLLPTFILDHLEAHQYTGVVAARAMFVDLSGFTPLTETLLARGGAGAEELSQILNQIFEPLVHEVYGRGGFIPYFAGDAFTAIFPLDKADINAFLEAALAVRAYFRQRSFRFGEFTIGLKIGLSAGDITWGIVGRHFRAYYFRGEPIDGSARCQAKAKNQDFSIVFDESLMADIQQHGSPFHRIEAGYFALDQGLQPQQTVPAILPTTPPDENILYQFLSQEIVHFQGEGEFRPVISVFIAFEGLDDHRHFNRFVGIILEQINNFSGYFKEIDFGDKGGVLVCFFGAPVSFENTVDRTLEFIFVLQQELQELQQQHGLRFKVGITMGTAYAGFVGGRERCQYAVVGNRVNLAARLMTHAHWGEVLVDREVRKSRHFHFQHRGDIHYKGILGTVPTFKLLSKNEEAIPTYTSSMIGRDVEMHQLIDFAQPLFQKAPAGLAVVYGEAGIGKSRLMYELRRSLTAEDAVQWIFCPADQILRKPFNPFIYFLKNYFDQSLEDAAAVNLQQFETNFQQIIDRLSLLQSNQAVVLREELVRTKSVLAAQLGIVYFNSLWEVLDARGRYENTIQAIINLLLAESLLQPTVLELEDAHWLDDSSADLLQELLRHLRRYPLLVILTSRYGDDGSRPQFVEEEQNILPSSALLEIDLNSLGSSFVRDFTVNKLQGPVTDAFFQLLLRVSNSNPFYLEQLLEYFQEQQLLEKQGEDWHLRDINVHLSSSINAILTARIDRLDSLVKETVKAAAVIGREFDVSVLTEVMKANEEFSRSTTGVGTLLSDQIDVAERSQIWRSMNELRYIFRHALLREAAYNMQLRTRLQQIHRLIAEAIERLYADNLEDRYVDLAFHYEQAAIFDKMVHYLRKAADHSRRNFQNQQALDFYEKLLEKIQDRDDLDRLIKTLLQKGRILELIGQWDKCKESYRKAMDLARQHRDALLLGRSHYHLGRVLMLLGDYPQSMRYQRQALALFESIADDHGMADSLGNLGNLFFRQGNYAEAKNYFQQSIDLARKVSGRPMEAQIVANLGLTYMNQGNFDEGVTCLQEQMARCEKQNDKQGMATLTTYRGIIYLEKGDFQAAMDSFQQGLALATELGNKQLTSVAIGNMGVVLERQGDYRQAMEHYIRDLEMCEELGDKQGTAIALNLIGQLLNIQGDFHKAIEYLQKALMICEELGYQKGTAKSVNTLGDIFFYLKQYDRSLHFYNRAIDITRLIGNKLVLGASLVEKGVVLLESERPTELPQLVDESLQLAIELGNPDLDFDAHLLQAKYLLYQEQTENGRQQLLDLLDRDLSADQEAAVYYELHLLDPANESYRNNAIKHYEKLVAATPRFTYRERLTHLTE